jgi:CheY-like chemotaxis protein
MSKELTILVVDDDRAVCNVMQRLLEERGHTVCMAWTGEGALRLLESEPIDLVLLDLQLEPGGIDGWEVARRKQQNPALDKIPFIIISGSSASDAVSETPRNPLKGAHLFISKPIDVHMLLRAIDILEPTARTDKR